MSATLFTSGEFRAFELAAGDIPRMQRFFEENARYFHAISGAPAPATEGHDEFHSLPPPEWPMGRKWSLGFDAGGELAGLATLVADLFAAGVWHIGLFMVAEPRWGSGGPLYRDLEAWMLRQGARWLRLGVVAGNGRAERFWRREGFREVRRREGFMVGAQSNVLLVMAKQLAGGAWSDYERLVPRDRPGAP
ncbi:MAG TPA: GNAT family N-acetyltransferase [Usitatibacter sp.]|nr:GNAT family N-acetyltransferase [Usitatibacter sp.]